MAEVSELLTALGEAHRLPLAQAWVRCQRCSPAALTTAGAPFHLADDGVRGFRDACVEHHLRAGRGGLVEAAAEARRPRFSADVAKYSMDAYPLAHHARHCGLAACLAIRSRPRRGRGDLVLELFLPPDCRDGAAQKAAVEAIAATIRERFGNDAAATAIAIGGLQDLAFDIVADGECMPRPDRVIVSDIPELQLDDHGGDQRDPDEAAAVGSADAEAPELDNEDPRSRAGERRKKKVAKRKGEKNVSLEELQRYFSGSLKDAARSLGVCPTTMKRICRQHGISRWPYRKIAKANRSLDKIRRAFESVQVQGSASAMAASRRAPAPAAGLRPPAVPPPCLSSALGVASSQGSCQEPPRPLGSAAAARRTALRGGCGDAGVVTVKASYRGDIVRFRVPCSAGVTAVKGEVAKRLSLEADAFEVKYLDDDNEWVLLSCDADFQECLDVVPALSAAAGGSSGGSGAAQPVVRLMVQEVPESHGSSCASSD